MTFQVAAEDCTAQNSDALGSSEYHLWSSRPALLISEREQDTCFKHVDIPHGGNDKLWIVLSDKSENVAFVLSCTRGPLGNYPIFVVPCRSFSQPGREGNVIDTAMMALFHHLLQKVPPWRVFSVFSTANDSDAFARAFEAQAGAKEYGIRALQPPYYEVALYSYTRETFVEPDLRFPLRDGENIVIHLRLASMCDLRGAQRLCQASSETLPPYVLDDVEAELEARTLIENGQAWVYIVQQGDQEEVACLIATTRESDNVTAITKIFTASEWRHRRCVARLLHHVCNDIFPGPNKERVVLIVALEYLEAVGKVCLKLRFRGLEKERISNAEK